MKLKYRYEDPLIFINTATRPFVLPESLFMHVGWRKTSEGRPATHGEYAWSFSLLGNRNSMEIFEIDNPAELAKVCARVEKFHYSSEKILNKDYSKGNYFEHL